MKKIILSIAFVWSFYLAVAQEKEIKELLETQRLGYNKGNMIAYMQGLIKSDSLFVISKSRAKYGR